MRIAKIFRVYDSEGRFLIQGRLNKVCDFMGIKTYNYLFNRKKAEGFYLHKNYYIVEKGSANGYSYFYLELLYKQLGELSNVRKRLEVSKFALKSIGSVFDEEDIC